jgi:hypothetical protein
MTRAITIGFLVVIAAAVSPAAAPKPVIVKEGLICRTKQQDAELGDWITGLQTQADKALASAKSAQTSNGELQGKLDLASKDGIALQKERDQAILDKEHVLKKLHTDKWIISALAVIAAVLGVLNLPIPMPYRLYALAGAPAAATALVWLFL